ncbi:MAG: hypothetical protein GX894_03650 [Clostridia bacterium]|nr:hypothetical protein [Clostridia bacterium]
MIAVVWADLRAWSSERAKPSLLIVAAGLTAAGIFYRLQPELWGRVLIICLLWAGWQAGAEKWVRLKSWDWIRQERLGIARIVVGKLIAALVLIIFHTLPALPVLVTMTYVWGIPWVRLCRAVIFILTASWFFAALIFLASHLVWLGVQEARVLLGGGWLVLSAIIPFLHPLNPFLFTEKLLLPGPLVSIFPGLLTNLALMFFSALLLWRYNKKRFKAVKAGTMEKNGGGGVRR